MRRAGEGGAGCGGAEPPSGGRWARPRGLGGGVPLEWPEFPLARGWPSVPEDGVWGEDEDVGSQVPGSWLYIEDEPTLHRWEPVSRL